MQLNHTPVVVIGAGPAGLTAAYELGRRGIRSLVLEKSDKPGGLARTETYKGYRFDIGGHRFYTKVDEVQRLWQGMLGEDFLKVGRLSRIYYRGHFFRYPLEFLNALANVGGIESLRILLSYLRARLWPSAREENFEEWVINRFGRRLHEMFFRAYTEKVWGLPCNRIRADWAAQRIQGLSLKSVVANALFGNSRSKSLIKEFHYPVLGPGMMWRRFQEVVEQGGSQVLFGTETIQLLWKDRRVKSLLLKSAGQEAEVSADHFISSMPLGELLTRMEPRPAAPVLEAAHKLTYRAFVLVGLILNRAEVFPDNWIYIHNPQVKVGRIQNFKNWSPAMVPDLRKTSLGMEYFCTKGDALWTLSDRELIQLAKRELSQLGLADVSEVEDGVVFRQTKAYPVYDSEYRTHLETIQHFLAGIENLQTIGRNGLHRYNNQDHSMLTGMLAVRNLLGETHDLWRVNTERSYYEQFTTESSCRTPR